MKDIAVISFYWIHLGAAMFWVGGIAFILFIALPSANKVMGSESGRIMSEISGRFGPLANLSILVLITTGAVLTKMRTPIVDYIHPENSWTLALLVKLVLVLFMVAIHFFRGLILSRRIARSEDGVVKQSLQKLSLNLVKTNLALGLVIILLSVVQSYLRGY
jgi:uncharacterized membrane protein